MSTRPSREGWHGWDEYAPFYDWENARTLGRRDVPFWRGVARTSGGPVLELGCGTGRVSLALARSGIQLVGIDRSAEMLARLRSRALRASFGAQARRQSGALRASFGVAARRRLRAVRGDIRHLPFASGAFPTVLAPYGILQSLLSDRDLTATLNEVARVLAPGGTFGIDLVPDVPNWREYSQRVQHRGRAAGGAHLTLIESVHQDRARHLTTFDQRYVVKRKGHTAVHHFELTFRTLTVQQMSRRLGKAGFAIESALGDYRGGPWNARAEVWIILAKKM
ncbi:MAG: class I SAM-dependent methyltransferase [Acidobacteria bacterium]|nr:class I SAM-dependent methyltransferase [Acidobacteriota bacterium]